MLKTETETLGRGDAVTIIVQRIQTSFTELAVSPPHRVAVSLSSAE